MGQLGLGEVVLFYATIGYLFLKFLSFPLAVAFFVAIALANVIGWVLLSVLSLATVAVPVVLRNQGRSLRAPWTLIMVSLGVVGLLGAITSAVIPAAMHW